MSFSPRALFSRFSFALLAVYLGTALLAFLLFARVTAGLNLELAHRHAEQLSLQDQARILQPIVRELALARQMASSPQLVQWARNDSDPLLRAQALQELDNYRSHFAEHSWVFAIERTGHYYYNDAENHYAERQPVVQMKPGNPVDDWFYATMAQVDDVALNVNYDTNLKVTKLWLNAIVYDGKRKLGVAGTSIHLDRFLQNVFAGQRAGVEPLLLDGHGAFQAVSAAEKIEFASLIKAPAERKTLVRELDTPADQARLQAALTALRAGGQAVQTLTVQRGGKAQVLGLAYLRDIDWFNVVALDLEVLQGEWQLGRLALVFGLGLALGVAAIFLVLQRLLLQPLTRLTASARRMAAGDYAIALPPGPGAEVGALTESFNQMASAVRGATAELERTVEQRTAELQRSYENIGFVSAAGQAINSSLEMELIFQALYRCVNALMHTQTFGLAFYQEQDDSLDIAMIMYDGRRVPPFKRALSERNALSVYCARTRQSLVIGDFEQEAGRYIDDPAQATPAAIEASGGRYQEKPSHMYVPLLINARLLGVMGVMSGKKNAFAPWHLDLFQMLAGYVASAIANAQAHEHLRRAVQELQQTQEQLLLQEKMAALGTLSAGVAHEINNPTHFAHIAAQNLQVDLQAFATLLNELVQADEAPEVVELFSKRFELLNAHIVTILSGTERIKTIVKDLRAFTRQDASETHVLPISECLHSTVHLVRASYQDQIDFVLELEADPLLECHPAQLNQVFMNLIVNGCQAIRERARAQPGFGRGCISVRTSVEAGWLRIDIEDNGCGIKPELQTHVLEPFFTTKPVGEGTGLGLSISYGIIQKHGGDLQFRSSPGQGSVFTVRLPLVAPVRGGGDE